MSEERKLINPIATDETLTLHHEFFYIVRTEMYSLQICAATVCFKE